MLINSTLIYCLIPELKFRLLRGRIHKVKQSEDGKELIFSVKNDNKFVHLFYSSDPVNCRIELRAQRDFERVKERFSDSRLFQAILRAEIKRIEQIDFDRIITITLVKRTELEPEKKLDLVFELTGRNTNAILVDKKEGTILDCLKKIGPARSRYRQIAPGLKYVPPPPPGRRNPLEVKEEEFKQSLSHKPQTNISSFLLDTFSGIDKLLAQKITLDSSIPEDKKISELTDVEKEKIIWSFQDTFLKVKTHKINPHTVLDEKRSPVAVSPFDLSFIPKNQKESHRSLCFTIRNFFKLKTEKEKELNLRREILTLIRKGQKTFENLLSKLRESLKSAEKYGEYKKIADLLMINKHRVKKGQKILRVKDVFHPEEKALNIKLNPVLSALQNAKLYYKKYTKAKDSLNRVRQRTAQIEQKLKMLHRISDDLEPGGLDADGAREKLAALGLYKKPGEIKKRERPKKKLSPREFVTPDGWKILVGRNSKENDYLTFKMAKPYDFWFHAQDAGGSHLVLRRENRNQQPSTKTLIQAAKIAAYYSQARSSKKVAVIYTLAKHVRKPKKGKPGLVLVYKEKTMMVIPALPPQWQKPLSLKKQQQT
jgi:predicted ribosome quality control (RQC) complex YloA/Tae2 family protein